jgi:hypothetical protein
MVTMTELLQKKIKNINDQIDHERNIGNGIEYIDKNIIFLNQLKGELEGLLKLIQSKIITEL